MRVLVVGAGALGGYFGGRLAEAGRDVTFLVRPHRAEQIARHGLRIESVHGDADLRPRTVLAGAVGGPYDLVLLAVKAYALDTAMDDLAPAVGPATAVLPVLNGMRHLDALGARFGPDRILGGVAQIPATLGPEGQVRHLGRVHDLAFGEAAGGDSARVRAVAALCGGAGFDARASGLIAQEMWEKWAMLAALAGMTCLMRASVGDILAAPGGREAMLAAFAEAGRWPRPRGTSRARPPWRGRWACSRRARRSPPPCCATSRATAPRRASTCWATWRNGRSAWACRRPSSGSRAATSPPTPPAGSGRVKRRGGNAPSIHPHHELAEIRALQQADEGPRRARSPSTTSSRHFTRPSRIQPSISARNRP